MDNMANKQAYTWLFVMMVLNLCLLIYASSGLSISYKEALILYDFKTPLHYLVKLSCDIFGYNDFGLRVVFMALHSINILLFYHVCKTFFRKNQDALLSVFMYMLLPATNTAALVVNEASLVIFFTLSFVLSWQKKFYIVSYLILLSAFFIDNSFTILYLSLIFYALFKRKKLLFALSLVLFALSFYMYGFETHGKPRGHFLDTIGVYAATFSPFVMMYYVYTLYRIAIKEKKHLIWYISFIAFIFTLIFSLRQKLALEDFLPFAIISLPLMIGVFLNSYRVRLPKHRSLHKFVFGFVLFSLVLSFCFVLTNKSLYLFEKNPKKHFAYKYNVARELSLWLKDQNMTKIYMQDKKMSLRLKFYGIMQGKSVELVELKLNDNAKENFKLDYMSKPIARYRLVLHAKTNKE